MQLSRHTAPLMLSLLSLGACGGDAPPEVVRAAVSGVCQWNFEATIRSGPSTGTRLAGHLVLRKTGTGTAEGALLQAGKVAGEIDTIPVTAAFTDKNDITLAFKLASGGTIQGTGPMGGSFEQCPAPFQGSASGPQPGDSGDWGSTCFFCGGVGGGVATCTAPTVINPFYDAASSRVFMSSAASCIQLGATARLGPLFGSLTSAPYTLSFDSSGTLFKTTAVSATDFPVGTCRGVVVTNPNGAASGPVGVCR